MTLQQHYDYNCKLPSDINEHLETLKEYSSECDHITEMGVRWVVSTYAFLMGKPKKMISYDINFANTDFIKELVKDDTDFEFKVANTLDLEIEETDLLFIDTLHNYNQLKGELELHGNKAKKYIIFHDTTSFEWIGESYNGKVDEIGLWPAIEEFLESNPHWELHERYTNNNGLTILKRK
jgi:hypothetical protein